jgi:hypothetical protein
VSDADTVELLRELIAEVRRIRAAVERQRAQPPHPAAAALLAAAARAFGDRVWTTAELQARALERDAAGEALAAAIAATGRASTGGLGKWLSAQRESPAGGRVIVRLNDDGGPALWMVRDQTPETGRAA